MKKNKKKELKKARIGYGLILPTPQKEDYILGGLTKLPKIVLQADGQWDAFLPIPEYQALGTETMACTCFGTLSVGEMIIKKKYTNEKNFSVDGWRGRRGLPRMEQTPTLPPNISAKAAFHCRSAGTIHPI